MQIEIHSQGLLLTDELRDWTKRRLRFALARVEQRIQRVSVHFSDLNGPRGGVDKCCRVQARLDGLGEMVIEDTQADPFLAISHAAERFARTATRRLECRTTRAQKLPRRPNRRSMGDSGPELTQL